MKIEFDSTTCHPWNDIQRVLANMSTLTVDAGGTTYRGPACLEIDEQRNAVLTIGPKPKPAKRGKK
jgi:hypothetical protein